MLENYIFRLVMWGSLFYPGLLMGFTEKLVSRVLVWGA